MPKLINIFFVKTLVFQEWDQKMELTQTQLHRYRWLNQVRVWTKYFNSATFCVPGTKLICFLMLQILLSGKRTTREVDMSTIASRTEDNKATFSKNTTKPG